MGFLVDTQKEGGGHSWGYVRSLVRRKQVDSANGQAQGHQLAKALTVPHLVAIGNLISQYLFLGFLMNSQILILLILVCSIHVKKFRFLL